MLLCDLQLRIKKTHFGILRGRIGEHIGECLIEKVPQAEAILRQLEKVLIVRLDDGEAAAEKLKGEIIELLRIEQQLAGQLIDTVACINEIGTISQWNAQHDDRTNGKQLQKAKIVIGCIERIDQIGQNWRNVTSVFRADRSIANNGIKRYGKEMQRRDESFWFANLPVGQVQLVNDLLRENGRGNHAESIQILKVEILQIDLVNSVDDNAGKFIDCLLV